MLKRNGLAQLLQWKACACDLKASLSAHLHRRHARIVCGNLTVEDDVLSSMGCFLGEERGDLPPQRACRAITKLADAVDKEPFAGGKAGRKRIVESGWDRIASQPRTSRKDFIAEGQISGTDREVRWSLLWTT